MCAAALNLSGLGMTLQKPAELKEPSVNDDGYSLTELNSQLSQFKEIVVDFKNAGLKIQKIEQLDNRLLWQKYTNEKQTIETRKPQDPAFELNEKYLYHGTSARKDFICTEGLDARLSKKGRFGQGIYFSDNPLKCVKYAEKEEITSFILLARVILGCSKVYHDRASDRMLQREPEKKGNYKGWRFYDSAMGCPKDYREYVIYRNDRALIECVITYSKDKDSTASSIPNSRVTNYNVSSPTSTFHTSTQPLSNKLNDKPLQASITNIDDDDDSDSDTTDEDEKPDFSDSDQDEVNDKGNSSDSSIEDDKKQSLNTKTPMAAAPIAPTLRAPRGEDILADKKREFARKTGETRHHVIESYLSTTGLDVDRAVQLFRDKDIKKREMVRQQMQRQVEEQNKAEEPETYEDALDDPERLRMAGEENGEVIMEAVTDNFLMVVGLDDNDNNRKLGRKFLFSCDYNLDASIVAYYESL